MAAVRRWTVEISVGEQDDGLLTHAEARLVVDDRTDLVGHGTAQRHDEEADVAEIGDELAMARALSELSNKLVHAVAGNVDGIAKRLRYVVRR